MSSVSAFRADNIGMWQLLSEFYFIFQTPEVPSNPFSLYVFLSFKFQPSSDCMFMNILRKRYLSFVNIPNMYCLFTPLPVSQSSCTLRRVSRSNASFMFSIAGSPRTYNKQFLIGGFWSLFLPQPRGIMWLYCQSFITKLSFTIKMTISRYDLSSRI